MKKKIYSLLLMICMCFCFLTGCSLSYTDESYKNDDVILTVGNTQITREELINQFSNFYYYDNYSQYFMFNSGPMTEMFYSSTISRIIILEKAKELLNDGATPLTGTIRFYTKDYEDIWDKIYDSINKQLDTNEKAVLLNQGLDEDELPERLQTSKKKETAYIYPEYNFEEDSLLVAPDYTNEGNPELDFDQQYRLLETEKIFRYISSAADAEEKEYTNIPNEEKAARSVAFNMYVENLILNAKAKGERYDKESVLKVELERLYKSYYESALYTKYQEYIEGEVADESNGYLTPEVIANRFIELTNKDVQSNYSEESYAEIISSNDNESLILYHHDGEYTYFTVQHVLLQFSEEISELLKQHPGHVANVNSIYRNEYESYRSALINKYYGSVQDMTTTVRDAETGLTVEGEKIKASEIVAKLNGVSGSYERSLAFNKLSWQYSDDTGSLTDDLKGKTGFTVTNEVDNHSGFVVDFAMGARKLYSDILAGTTSVGEDVEYVVSDFGLHLMMVTGVYTPGKLIETVKDDKTGFIDTNTLIQKMKETKVSNMTEQTVYEYYYDMIKEELVGNNGKHFSDHRNLLVAEYSDDGKIDDDNKLSYEELAKAIGV